MLSATADSSLVSTTSEPLMTTTPLLPPSSISSIFTEARSELEDDDEEEEEEALPSLAGDVSGGIVSSLHDLDPQLYKVCSFVLGVYRICVSVFVNLKSQGSRIIRFFSCNTSKIEIFLKRNKNVRLCDTLSWERDKRHVRTKGGRWLRGGSVQLRLRFRN